MLEWGSAVHTEGTLYPYGAGTADKEVQMDSEDGSSPYIWPPMGFPFMGKSYDKISVGFQQQIYS